MKRIFFSITFLMLLSLLVTGQTTQNTLSLGGGILFTRSVDKDDFETISEFHVRPAVGYFLTDRFELGLATDLGIGKGEIYDDEDAMIRSKSMMIGPFAKYYLKTPVTNLVFTIKGQASVMFWQREIKFEGSGKFETRSETFGLSLSPGFTYFFSKKWGLNFQFRGISFAQIPYLDLTGWAYDEREEFVFDVSFRPTLEFRYYINR
jgi:hypothetical protein